MGRRTNPLSLRVGRLLNWPSNVTSPFLSSYVKHIFQGLLVSEPGLRATATGEITVNVTVFGQGADGHPRILNPALDFSSLSLPEALGRMETRIENMTSKHHYFKDVFASSSAGSLAQETERRFGTLGAIGIFPQQFSLASGSTQKQPIVNLKVNVIRNPFLNADIMAQYIARRLENGDSLGRVYRELLANMG